MMRNIKVYVVDECLLPAQTFYSTGQESHGKQKTII